MTAEEKWDKIVSIVQAKKPAKENEVEDVWADIFSEIFGYSKIDEEIERQRKIPIGSSQRTVPDIIVKDSSAKKDLFTVELKQHNLPFDERYKDQLFSYMLLLRLNVGILICDKIHVYYGNDGNALHMEIEFKSGNAHGATFIELFSKEKFDESAVKAFIEAQEALHTQAQTIRTELQRGSASDIIKQYYRSQYSEEAVEMALQDVHVSVSMDMQQQEAPEQNANAALPAVAEKKDNTQYNFKGNTYGKGRLVLAVISDYVRSHPATTQEELKSIFHKKLQGSTEVVENKETAEAVHQRKLRKWEQSGKARKNKPKFRFFQEEKLHLSDGKMYVSTEWGSGNIDRFIDAAKKLGYDITEA
ncbi:MAG: type I restriction enzyme HsdR N-terminal domain-containing protein [Treponema sp.]|nr:type I restriction enzyme HsdR N-terminal domain-containing protein [Treponema sp.]